ncbi:MAG: anaerobic ribonucleoside-triphosphate reductase [Planctomycetota bacterium]|nr:anaerobic ribonucleoside-triphosphate reductase [Planctomycetota bacterium]
MELAQFYHQVEAHTELTGVGVDQPCDNNHQPGVIVRHQPTGLTTRLPLAAVEAADWPSLEEVLLGHREPQVLQHMTRVVGYFSRVENWNKSKVGELRDRQKGSYSIAG